MRVGGSSVILSFSFCADTVQPATLKPTQAGNYPFQLGYIPQQKSHWILVAIEQRYMRDRYSPCTVSPPDILPLIDAVVSVRHPVDLVNWLKGDVQKFLPHDLLLCIWGDFQLGPVQYEMLSALPGVGHEGTSATSMTSLFADLFDRWMNADCKPVVLHSINQRYFLWPGADNDATSVAMSAMRSSLVHGIRDQRNRQDCLFVLYSKLPQRKRRERVAIKLLLPYLDCALRQVQSTHHTYASSAVTSDPRPNSAMIGTRTDDQTALSEHEIEIMKWVAKGKSNAEISSLLNVSSFTVKSHMQGIFKKLDVFSRAQAVLAFSGAAKSINAA